jgi:uncharacterized protein YkwD
MRGICVLVLMGLSCAVPARYVPRPTTDIEAMERRVHELVNEYRRSQRLDPLKYSDVVADECREHSAAMARQNAELSHKGLDRRLKEIGKRIVFRRAAENVAVNKGYAHPAAQAVQGWLKSPGHHANLIDNFNMTGVGIARSADGTYYFTQIYLLVR